MCAGNHGMVRLGDQRPLLLGFTSPQNEDHARLLRGNQFDHAIGESLPPASMMRIGHVGLDREDRVEQEDALSGPGYQIPVIRDPTSKIFMKFPIDALFLGRDLKVVRMIEDLKPWRVSPWILRAHSVLELGGGALRGRAGLGDVVEFR